jgi:hypothetical protein
MSTGPCAQKTMKSLHQLGTRNISHTPRHPLGETRALIWFNRLLVKVWQEHT